MMQWHDSLICEILTKGSRKDSVGTAATPNFALSSLLVINQSWIVTC